MKSISALLEALSHMEERTGMSQLLICRKDSVRIEQSRGVQTLHFTTYTKSELSNMTIDDLFDHAEKSMKRSKT